MSPSHHLGVTNMNKRLATTQIESRTPLIVFGDKGPSNLYTGTIDLNPFKKTVPAYRLTKTGWVSSNQHFIEQYNKLLKVVQNNSFPDLRYPSRLFEDIHRDHFLDNPKNLSLLFSNARHLIDRFPTQKVVGLGQSPAWVLEAAKRLDNRPDRFSHVAFSGGWYDLHLNDIPDQRGSKTQTERYRSYLSECGLTPTDIIETPIVLVERTYSGKGLKSFLEILLEWGNDLNKLKELKDALHTHIIICQDFRGPQCPQSSPEDLGIKSGQMTDGHFLEQMSNSPDDLDRLIPHYDHSKWDHRPDFIGLPTTYTGVISCRLDDYCSDIFNSSRHTTGALLMVPDAA